MPRMHGVEVIEQVKAAPANASLAIVMLTTEGQPALIRRARAAAQHLA
ncbi:MAG: CheY-like chemotaxis protein [Kiritimatiellia bacterium]|jgi:CheY-like chemotaxis protein